LVLSKIPSLFQKIILIPNKFSKICNIKFTVDLPPTADGTLLLLALLAKRGAAAGREVLFEDKLLPCLLVIVMPPPPCCERSFDCVRRKRPFLD